MTLTPELIIAAVVPSLAVAASYGAQRADHKSLCAQVAKIEKHLFNGLTDKVSAIHTRTSVLEAFDRRDADDVRDLMEMRHHARRLGDPQ